MKQVSKYFGVVAIIALFALVAISGSMDQADAMKSKGKPNQFFGQKTKHIVCGAKLCGSGENPDPKNEGRAK
jgi:hypothetical protein